MRIILRIAWTELKTLFYSPIAWLILIIFSFQIGLVYSGLFGSFVNSQTWGYSLFNVTYRIFGSRDTLFPTVLEYLYLYIPLITMNLMTRETSSGSIKLLFSTPISNTQIVLGKFFAMVAYSLALAAVLVLCIVFGVCTIENVDFWPLFSGLIGLILLMCAYSAIGLFMSSLTSYQIVAAVGTLFTLFLLNKVGSVGQDIAFVRDISYWLCMSGRASGFIAGLVCSEDVLYFLIVICLFLSFTVFRLQSNRQNRSWYKTMAHYLCATVVAFGVGYITTLPQTKVFWDATQMKRNTLLPQSQDIIKKLDGGLTITAYTNILGPNYWLTLPDEINQDKDRFKDYLRFKPEIKMKYVYYYDDVENASLDKKYPGSDLEDRARKWCKRINFNYDKLLTPEQIRSQVDLSSEGNNFVRLIERENGQKIFLRVFNDRMKHPSEVEFIATCKRLVMQLPVVGFVQGYGARDIHQDASRDYTYFANEKTFRYALINQGFDVSDVNLDKAISDSISILVLADLRTPLSEEANENLRKYIQRGGNMLIAAEGQHPEAMQSLYDELGVKLMPGTIVHETDQQPVDLVTAHPTPIAKDFSYVFKELEEYSHVVTMPSCVGLDYSEAEQKGFLAQPLLQTDTLGWWNELEDKYFVDMMPNYNPQIGEKKQVFTTCVALSRTINEKEQKIVFIGDADCMSNGELGIERSGIYADNYSIITGGFYWLSDNEVPIDPTRPSAPDKRVRLTAKTFAFWKLVFTWGIPIAMLLISIFIYRKRTRR